MTALSVNIPITRRTDESEAAFGAFGVAVTEAAGRLGYPLLWVLAEPALQPSADEPGSGDMSYPHAMIGA
ncbi:hypothetical protein [Mycobacterium sp. 3519A]|uniref:hypothetical protein n=1 Tax=Mycobacterium sp. 3519A TaxID=2057184 RepID=UPI000C7E1F37|nr:hypothetical protein [Mycobacterium sp. 3519A]